MLERVQVLGILISRTTGEESYEEAIEESNRLLLNRMLAAIFASTFLLTCIPQHKESRIDRSFSLKNKNSDHRASYLPITSKTDASQPRQKMEVPLPSFLVLFFSPTQKVSAKKMPSFISLIQYMDLKHFLLWIILPLVGMATRWFLRNVSGTDNLHGKLSFSPKALPKSSTTFYLLQSTSYCGLANLSF